VTALERGLMTVTVRRPALAVLELSGLSFISSLGMGAMVAFAKGIELAGGHVVTAGAKKPVRESMQRARLDIMMPLFETVEEAVVGAAATSPQQRQVG